MVFRTYPNLRYLILLIVGILTATYFSLSFGGWAFLLCLGLGGLGIFVKKLYLLRHSLTVSFYFLGVWVTHLNNHSLHLHHLVNQSNFSYYWIEIRSYTETKSKTYKAIAEIKGIYKNNAWTSATGKILVYFNKETGVVPQFCDWYVLRNNLREIAAPKNPYEFDYKKYQARQNIFHHQFVRTGDFKRVGQGNKDLFYWANQANRYTHEVFSEILDNSQQLGVAEAMVGGMRAELDDETRSWFTNTGTVHALAVSGMHVAILFWVVNALLSKVLNKRRWPFLLAVLSILWLYAVFTGLSPSVCRSTLMFTLFQVATFIKRDGNSINVLIFSALALLLFVPNWIYDVGFQLSYLAVLGILVFYPWLSRWFSISFYPLRWLWQISVVSIAAQLYTLPLSLYYFQQFPNYSLVANPIVSLLCAVLLPVGLMVLVLYKIPLLGMLLAWVFKWIVTLLNTCVEWISSFPNAITEGIYLSQAVVVAMFVLIGLLQLYLRYRRIESLQLLLLGIFVITVFGSWQIISSKKQNEITFHYIPYGSGLSIIQGKEAVFISNDSLIQEPKIKQYHLKNYYNQKRVKSVNYKAFAEDENHLLELSTHNLVWIKNKTSKLEIQPADIIWVSNNSLSDTTLSAYKWMILDGTNNKWYIEKMKKNYKDAVVLYETGSKTLNFAKE